MKSLEVLSLLLLPSLFFCHENFTNSSSTVVALILARGGSKGIKLKNIQKINGVTLLGISLTEIQRSKLFESIWVSTDHEDIALEAEKCEGKIVFHII